MRSGVGPGPGHPFTGFGGPTPQVPYHLHLRFYGFPVGVVATFLGVESRSETLRVRLLPSERALLGRRAGEVGLSVSDFVRRELGFGGAVRGRPRSAEPVAARRVVDVKRREARAAELVRQGRPEHLARIQAAREAQRLLEGK